ncbi:MAG: CDP-2,3-bis-(O-geranylgeranyl)-sn-glycerol synthase [Ignisphaera sp.]|jgi:CDP-2,3-bis-(O-geranylgeranyl)-sn-glycerol synthase|nr:CDP-2,3-bis-(O-geranylgeranyl)-sn-glycerol synthase [Ignisphaera sp.]MCC6056232.1 CDP-2,3-bis-(O-geranylgeranyl)-sn-glycerol synthase [Desulfurococcaceae archaeon]
MVDLNTIIRILWFLLPAYVANGTPVVTARLLQKLGFQRHPIDFGKKFVDGRRILGDSKSWEGLITGILTGTLAGYMQSLYQLIKAPTNFVIVGFVLSIGAMIGDILGAFIKRRLGLNPGEPVLLLDQLLFIITALGLSTILNLLKLSLFEWLMAITLTFILHIITNFLAYVVGLKDVPW